MNAEDLLRNLIGARPPHGRSRHLFEALRVGRLEEPHTDFLSWLLDPRGPMSNGQVLDQLLLALRLDDFVGQRPNRVAREIPLGTERLDILIEWDSFKVIVENKTVNREHDDQCARYLTTFGIATPEHGRLIYLSPAGTPPPSVSATDPRLRAMSYGELHRILEAAARIETHPRGQILLAEFAKAVSTIAGIPIMPETTPQLSDVSRTLLRFGRRVDQLLEAARADTAEVILWTVREATRRLMVIMGPSMQVLDYDNQAWLFRKPNWTVQGFDFGIAYSAEETVGISFLHDYEHCIGIRLQPNEHASQVGEQEQVAHFIASELATAWPQQCGQLAWPNTPKVYEWWPHWIDCRVGEDESWETWSANVVEGLESLAVQFSKILDRIGSTERGGTTR